MVTIRPYLLSDYDIVRRICLETSDMNKRTEISRQIILKTYCDYYIECEPHNCFVAVNDENVPVGYIICSESYGEYKAKFEEKYLPTLKQFGFSAGLTARGNIIMYRMFAGYYPAHLHIDILPEYQHIGVGTRLMDTLVEHLRERDGRGLILAVGSKNKQAINFYTKYGFKEIKKTSGFKLLGFELI